MPQAVLFPNMVEFPSESMKRYARELTDALRRVVAPGDWNFEEIVCHEVRAARRFLPGGIGEKTASRLGRFVQYPRLASRAVGDVFHVLDHSHANLTLSLPGKRSVITCHDIIPLLAAKGEIPMPAKRATRYTFPLRIRCMMRCHTIIAGSESSKRDLVTHGGVPADKITVVYYGTNPLFTPEPPIGETRAEERRKLLAAHNLPPDARIALHVGSPMRYKNTPALFEMLHRLRDTALGKSLYLLRLGADFFPDEADLMRRLGVEDHVVFVGRVDDTALAAHYRAADVLVFPSLYEGFGWPPLEAMACGTPAITSNVASLPEVVGDAGITVAPMDHDALADAVRRILTQPGLAQEWSDKALRQASKFTWDKCAQDTFAVYERVFQDNGGVVNARDGSARKRGATA